MTLCRFGSINKFAMNRRAAFWSGRLTGGIPSADTIARSACRCDVEAIRLQLQTIYRKLKRRKGLRSPFHPSLFGLIIDGHECFASYRRHCKDCLQRRIKTPQGERIQYYHRVVTAVLLCENFVILLDVEQQKPKEGEVICAMRLFERLMKMYPKAFDIISADGLYAQRPFIKMVRKHRKHCIVVLKDDRRDLLQEAQKHFLRHAPVLYNDNHRQRRVWDIDVKAFWANTSITIRVVRSVELSYICRQGTREKEAKTSDWIWATTIPRSILSAQGLIIAGHRRWDIENKAFNELGKFWYVNHAYTHNANAIIAFWMLIMVAYNVFHAFFWFNLKPALRKQRSMILIAEMITAEFYCFDASG